MALESVATQTPRNPLDDVLTCESEFWRIPREDNRPLLRVNPEMPAYDALSLAACLAESISDMADDAVTSGAGIEPKGAFLVAFAANAIQALCNSAGV